MKVSTSKNIEILPFGGKDFDIDIHGQYSFTLSPRHYILLARAGADKVAL